MDVSLSLSGVASLTILSRFWSSMVEGESLLGQASLSFHFYTFLPFFLLSKSRDLSVWIWPFVSVWLVESLGSIDGSRVEEMFINLPVHVYDFDAISINWVWEIYIGYWIRRNNRNCEILPSTLSFKRREKGYYFFRIRVLYILFNHNLPQETNQLLFKILARYLNLSFSLQSRVEKVENLFELLYFLLGQTKGSYNSRAFSVKFKRSMLEKIVENCLSKLLSNVSDPFHGWISRVVYRVACFAGCSAKTLFNIFITFNALLALISRENICEIDAERRLQGVGWRVTKLGWLFVIYFESRSKR